MSRVPAAVSMQPREYTEARTRAENLGLNFSAYVNALIRADMRAGGDLRLHEAADVSTSCAVTDEPEKNADSIGVSVPTEAAKVRRKVNYRGTSRA